MNERRLLLIEDDPDTVQIVKFLLEAEGWSVCHLSQGRKAVEAAKDFLPDVLLLDGHLPDMTGQEVLQNLASCPQTTSIPVVAFTASDALSGPQVVGVITKPVHPLDFASDLNTLLERSI